MSTTAVRTASSSRPTPPPAPTAEHSPEHTPAEPSLAWVAGPGVGVGLVSALIGLDRSALWLDEAYSLGAIHQLGRTIRDTSGTMGGYYVLLRAWATVSESTWWLRSLSVVAAVAALVVVARVVMRLRGPRIARTTVILTALSTMWLDYAREARSYGVVLLLVALSWLAIDHALTAPDPQRRARWWALHTTLAVALPLVHGLGALQVLPQAGLVLAASADRTSWARLARGLVGSVAVTGALLAIGAGEVGDWVVPLGPDLLLGVVQIFTSPILPFTLALVALIAWGAMGQVRAMLATAGSDRARAAAPLLWGLAPLALLVLLSIIRPSLVPRYAIGCTPGLALLTAAGIDRIGRADLRRLATVGTIAILVVGHIEVHRTPTDGWTTVTTLVAERARAGDAVLLVNEEDRPPFEAEWRDRSSTPDIDLVGSDRPLGTVLRFEDDVPSRARVRAEAAAADRIWVVSDEMFGGIDATVTDLVDGSPSAPPTHRQVARWTDDGHSIEAALLERL